MSLTKTNFWLVWRNMVQRCNNPKHPNYKNYGGRGISVCRNWMKYENFENDMYLEYGYRIEEFGYNRKYTTLDRIDNNKNYCKENCRWATSKIQGNNRRKPKYARIGLGIEINGEKKSLSEWCRIYKVNYSTVVSRIHRKNGMTVIDAMSL